MADALFTRSRKYAEVAYKCKPAAFRSRVACGGDTFSLSCPNGSDHRLAILSAVFASAATGERYSTC
jgi:hypothetical protein